MAAFLIFAIVLFAAVIVSRSISVSYYSITPGQAESVAPNVKISGLATDSHRDRIMLTDVYLNSLTAFSWLFTHFDAHAQIIPAADLLTPGTSSAQLDEQGYIDMANSKDFARTAALRALGWKIPTTAVGSTIYSVLAGTSAAHARLQVGDRIVAVNGVPTTTACAVIGSTHDDAVGSKVRMTILPATISNIGAITYGARKVVSVRTIKPPANEPASQCPNVNSVPRSIVGLSLLDAVKYQWPGHISIATPSIGGPSAGLAMTLALIDRLSAGSLTGGHVIAATGTIDPLGDVGDVGGVAEKTVAVENAGATIFIVPQVEVSVARNASNGHLRVIGVTTLRQALKELRRLGGAAIVPLTKPYSLKSTT
jgi:PDZ domain-containing protein